MVASYDIDQVATLDSLDVDRVNRILFHFLGRQYLYLTFVSLVKEAHRPITGANGDEVL